MRVLAFQPWDRGSHRAVRQSIERSGGFEYHWVCLPGRAPRWRLRIGAAELLIAAQADGVLSASFDAILTTSMVDASQLRGLLPVAMRALPLVLYMHENQAAYPAASTVSAKVREQDNHLVMSNLASLLAADWIIWNSQFNQRSCLDGIESVLANAPKGERLGGDWRAAIKSKSEVIWPPVEPIPPGICDIHRENSGIRVVWPHRHEHDKGPEELLWIMDEYAKDLDLRLVLLGERTAPSVDDALGQLRVRHAERIVFDSFIESREDYLCELARADWVLSTAQHEFFGIAVVEAMLCGCLPWLPDRLSYPELLPPSARGLSPLALPGDSQAVRSAIRDHLAPALEDVAVGRIEAAIASALSET